jgi:hypothetical protein
MAKPVYSNLERPEPREPVMRYTSLAALVLMLTKNELPLIRIDRFRDPFEGSIPKSVIGQQALIQAGVNAQQMQVVMQQKPIRHIQTRTLGEPMPQWMGNRDVHAEHERMRKARIKSSYASCWRRGPESEGMWRLYCGEKDGVALSTTFAQLENSIKDSDVVAGLVQYGNYETMTAFNGELDHLMYKRLGFEFEQELRLLMTDEELYEKIKQNGPCESVPVRSIPWNLAGSIEKILVSPYADPWYVDAVKSVVESLDAGKTSLVTRVGWSELRAEAVF